MADSPFSYSIPKFGFVYETSLPLTLAYFFETVLKGRLAGRPYKMSETSGKAEGLNGEPLKGVGASR